MDFQKLKDLMDHFTSWRIPGNAAVVYLHGEKVFEYASGYSDVENKVPMSKNSLMYMYSASKPITCAAALTLWERGKFLINDKVSDYLPGWSDMKVLVKNDDGTEKLVPVERPVTIGDLFSMTSGLDYNTDRPSLSEARNRAYPVCNTVELMDAVGKDPLIFQPGERWNYGISHDVIGALVEVISGCSLKDYAKKMIFEPLGMDKTYYGGWDIPENLSVQYTYSDEKGTYVRESQKNYFIMGSDFYSGGAGVISTVGDMSKFARAMSMKGKAPDGASILAPATVDMMRRNRLSPAQMSSFDWDTLMGYGYGLGVRTMVDRAASGSPSPAGEFGWTGAAGAYELIDPDNELAMFYAHHMLNNQEWYTANRLRNVLYSCL